MSASNLAGLIVYRIVAGDSIEYLLVCKRKFNRYPHWCPPKGKIIGAEDELNCATRETLDLTGLAGDQLAIDESFRAELKYVDGIKPKQVVYVLARMNASSRALVIHNDDPQVELSWCNLENALSKVKFQSMQNILVQAEEYIESNREDALPEYQRSSWKTVGPKESPSAWRNSRNSPSDVDSQFRRLNVGDGQRGNRNAVDRDQQPQQNTQKSRPQDNPLYKTRLCEKYERDGECPYNEKCVFAHSASELRERKTTPSTPSFRNASDDRSRDQSGLSPQHQQPQQFQRQNSQQYQNQFSNLSLGQGQGLKQGQGQNQHYQNQGHGMNQNQHYQNQNQNYQQQQQQQQPRTPQSAVTKFDANPLYKTRLCQRFAEKGECPYNDKCQFAHGEAELRVAPEQPAQPKPARDGHYVQRAQNDQGHGSFNRNAAGQSQTWRRGGFGNTGERAQIPSFNRNASWSASARPIGSSPSFSDDGSVGSPSYPAVDRSPKPADSDEGDLKAPLAAPLITPVAQKIPPPGLVKLSSASASAKKPQETKPSAHAKSDVDGDKPWIKVVEVSDQDLQQMGSPLLETANGGDAAKSKPISKSAELEKRLAKDLAEFLARAGGASQEPSLQAAFKEITQLEFRNNLGKQQLLNVVVTAVFGPTKASGVSETIARYSELLAKIVTKPQDQAFMLNAWHRLLLDDDSAAAWQKKAPEVLGALYKESLLEEDVFNAWFSKNKGENHSPAISAMQPFAHWLETAEEE
ncbi:hypothetical protein H4R99_007219 [Coemansia sp. RSA 1722]|nr:hypothetical protein H4R99_007219 [Coemansia sp. RSA 1722]